MSADFELLTITEVAEMLKISVPSVRRLQHQRQIPFYKVGGSVRFFALYLRPRQDAR